MVFEEATMKCPKIRIASLRLAATVLLSLLWVSSCAKNNPTSGPSGESSGGAPVAGTPAQFYTPRGAVYNVKYTDNTVRVDFPTAQKAIRSVSHDGRVLILDASDPRLANLTVGKVLLLEHLGVRRIIGVQKQGSQIAIATASTSLADFIQDGQIKFSAPSDFRARHAERLSPSNMNPLARLWNAIQLDQVVHADMQCGNPAEAAVGLYLKGEVDNWEFEVQGEPEGKELIFCFNAGKKLASLTASVMAKGKLENVNTSFNAVVQGGKMQDFEYSSPISGDLNVKWAALTSAAGAGIGESRIKFPPFWKQVIDVDGLPFLLQANGNLIFTPGFGGAHDAAAGGFEVTYDGTGGLNIHGQTSAPEGQMSGEPNVEKTTSESMAAHGVVVAMAAPKVSLSLGTESFAEALEEVAPKGFLDKAAEALESGPFASLFKSVKKNFFNIEGGAYLQLVTEFDYAASGPLSIVPCTMTHLNLTGQAGADATFLAVKAETPTVNLFKVSKVNRDPDIDACGKK
jgi:hypothetical protein